MGRETAVRLTIYTDYSLRLLMYLAVCDGRLVTIGEVADAYGIAKDHLTKVAQQLGAAGDIETMRGKGGGMRLKKAAGSINLGAVVRRTEPDLALVPCFDGVDVCAIARACLLQTTLHDALAAFLAVLDRTTLADVVAPRRKLTALLGLGLVDAGRSRAAVTRQPSLLLWGRALLRSRGVSLCLPVVVTPHAPLEYWRWAPGEPMNVGFWNIPCPARRHVVTPDLMLAPLVGFDRANYRLGYGGGYFDRTLAAFSRRPTVVGVGYEFSALSTIHPQPHDIPMDKILTDRANDDS